MPDHFSSEAGAQLARDLDRGLPLPPSWYTDPVILAREWEHIFRRSWQYVGRAEQLVGVGDYLTGEAGGVPVVVVRGEREVRGFVNVCRHRRHLVMAGAGNCTSLQCPYHGWRYGLDGSLRAAPRSGEEEEFNPADLALLPVQVDTWGPFVFACAAPDAPPLARFLGELPELVGRNGLDLTRLQFRQREEWRTAGNWKVQIENYLECYHCPAAHRGFSSVVDVGQDAYALRAFEWGSCQLAPVRTEVRDSAGPQAPYDARGPLEVGQYYHLWPNFALSSHPGHPNLLVHVWIPDGPEHTRGVTERYFGPDVPEDFVEEVTAFSRQVGVEDRALTASVQAGLRSALPVSGRLLRKSEQLVLHFQKRVLRALLGQE